MYVVFNKVITICVFKTILAQQALFRATKNIEKRIFNPLSDGLIQKGVLNKFYLQGKNHVSVTYISILIYIFCSWGNIL